MPPRPSTGRLVLVAVAVALVALTVGPLFIVDDVPDRLATRWDASGEPTSSSSLGVLLGVVGLAIGICVIGLVVLAARRRPMRATLAPLLAGSAALLGAVFALPLWMILAANDGATDWRSVDGPSLVEVAVVVVGSLAIGAVASWAASALPARAPEPVGRVEPLDVSETAQVAWTRSLTVRWLVGLGVAMAVPGVVLVLLGQVGTGIVLVLSVAPVVVLARIRVFADRRGLTITYGWWSWPRTRIPIDRIAAATAIDVVPAEWGGWGYRGSVRLFRQAAVVLRKGEGILVELTDGRRFVVTIDDAATAAAVLGREIERSGR